MTLRIFPILHSVSADGQVDATTDGDNHDDDDIETGEITGKVIAKVLINQGVTVNTSNSLPRCSRVQNFRNIIKIYSFLMRFKIVVISFPSISTVSVVQLFNIL